jgi:hypothetical protein
MSTANHKKIRVYFIRPTSSIPYKPKRCEFQSFEARPPARLFVPQRGQRIDAHRAPCGNVTRKQRYAQEKKGDARKRQGIRRPHSVTLFLAMRTKTSFSCCKLFHLVAAKRTSRYAGLPFQPARYAHFTGSVPVAGRRFCLDEVDSARQRRAIENVHFNRFISRIPHISKKECTRGAGMNSSEH